MNYTFTTIVQQEDDWFVAKCLENDVASQGKTLDEAMDNLKEAIELYYDDSETLPVMKKTYITTLQVAV